MNILKRGFLSLMVFMTLIITMPIAANAEWKQDNKGWWYTEGSSWATGWRQIGGQQYYFDANGYMKTGWADINNDYYFFYTNGVMASNATIGTFVLGADGKWIPTSQVRLESKLAEQEAINKFTSQPVTIIEDVATSNKNSDKNEDDSDGYVTHIDKKDLEDLKNDN